MMQAFMEQASAWLSSTALSQYIIDQRWIFPGFEIFHFVGMAMLVGFALTLDLRMIGVARTMALLPLHRMLAFGLTGFAITAVTGVGFVIAAPSQYLPNAVFWFKMLFLALAGLNIGVFYTAGIYQTVETLGPGDHAPMPARIVGAVSLFLWAGVLFWGRMLAFLGIAF
jgi:hypothetical protein